MPLNIILATNVDLILLCLPIFMFSLKILYLTIYNNKTNLEIYKNPFFYYIIIIIINFLFLISFLIYHALLMQGNFLVMTLYMLTGYLEQVTAFLPFALSLFPPHSRFVGYADFICVYEVYFHHLHPSVFFLSLLSH
jgi:hypothetical protein